MDITLAIIIGTVFGFALNRAGATNPENIINMLRLHDTFLMKAILFAIGLSSIALFTGLYLGFVDHAHISIKGAYIGVVLGGALLGVGFAIAGYCPGTALAGFATGRKDALFFILGGLVGALAFTLSYEWLEKNTPLFDTLAGGKSTFVSTGNDKYENIVPLFDSELYGIIFGLAFVAIAAAIPRKILNK